MILGERSKHYFTKEIEIRLELNLRPTAVTHDVTQKTNSKFIL